MRVRDLQFGHERPHWGRDCEALGQSSEQPLFLAFVLHISGGHVQAHTWLAM